VGAAAGGGEAAVSTGGVPVGLAGPFGLNGCCGGGYCSVPAAG